jgi:hypothetical protein
VVTTIRAAVKKAAGPPNTGRRIERCAADAARAGLDQYPVHDQDEVQVEVVGQERLGGVEGGPRTSPQATGSTAAAQ